VRPKTVALDPGTYSRLISYRGSLEVSIQRSPNRYPSYLGRGRISLDDAVSFLLDQQEDHARRAGEARAKQRADRKAVSADLDGMDFSESLISDR
jgi:hypothetical protein